MSFIYRLFHKLCETLIKKFNLAECRTSYNMEEVTFLRDDVDYSLAILILLYSIYVFLFSKGQEYGAFSVQEAIICAGQSIS